MVVLPDNKLLIHLFVSLDTMSNYGSTSKNISGKGNHRDSINEI